ncbi:TPA: alpha/beta fold hydrolase [Klebsiella pneumoniae]|uniref:alpha/beta fold hydrolase n=1 Tax=Klebsiella pneumoniae complex TaxID=3390273 RepID=UPI0010DFCC43|nr:MULTISPECIES: alpha/beta fold hydrolase [Klebsiella]MCE0321921.1 alpha/beta fold hydrolase [Klebsiella pneumoniae]MCP5952810.1 alpha/beta fold hydrolase [Klebsiella pneumoniae]MCQ0475835.1 alpha/beta fold hydrolase [Klebsiella pneumoniae]MCQ0780471.1 alpha/beta fold hydrolase [Klebsiella pneumoniae]MDG0784105.1 alpha/beta fold hydrolase [Klebsiella pneumoniae]
MRQVRNIPGSLPGCAATFGQRSPQSRNLKSLIIGSAMLSLCHSAWSATPPTAHQHSRQHLSAPVKAVANQQISIETPSGNGLLPVFADRPINQAAPDVVRVFIVIHGTLRNADAYYATGRKVVKKAGDAGKGTMVVAPQFLTVPDLKAFSLPAPVLAWTQQGWKDGAPSLTPAPISSFSALDALLTHFANRTLYPSLSTIVIMGHSAGAQYVQRYAVVGHKNQKLAQTGVAVRYVVANPSSYLYFTDDRPNSKTITNGTCPRATEWKYGFKSAPPYVASQDISKLESQYLSRDVVYLLGQADTNPYTHYIDRSCAAMAQGPYRLARGLAYFNYLQSRHPTDLAQKIVEVPGVGHNHSAMFTSDCGIAALFKLNLPQTCPVVGKSEPTVQ